MSDTPTNAGARRTLRPSWGALAAVVLALVALFMGAERATRSPDFCASCHAPERQHVRGHASTRCDACHASKFTERLGLLGHVITRSRASRGHGAVDRNTCAS